MKKAALLTLFGLLIGSGVTAAVPGQMSVQGRLLNAGSPMNGAHPATFRIYDSASGGTALWTEDDSLSAQNGIFSAALGSATPIPAIVFAAQLRWLEVTVDGSTLAPRLPLTTSAYAFRAQRSDTADVALSGAAGNELWSTDGTNVWRPSGKVGIGTSAPTELLHLEQSSVGQVSRLLLRSNVPGASPYGEIQFQNTLAPEQGIAAEIYATRPVATWGQEGDLVFMTNPGNPLPALAERVRITKDGNVGIGTNAPDAALDLRGIAEVSDDGASPDTRAYASFGVTRSAAAANESYIGLTKQATVPWALGIGSGDDFIVGTANPSRQIPAPRLSISYNGTVTIPGSLNVGGTKCREVNDPQYGKLYFNAVESGTADFTDRGEGRLVNGTCHVEVSPKWLAGVTIDGAHPMQVTVTAYYGPHGGQEYVERTRSGFTLVDPSGSNVGFGWKVDARQRGYEDLYLNQPEATAAKQGRAR